MTITSFRLWNKFVLIALSRFYRDLFTIPTELRNVLETCLGEDPCPQTLELYMPQVRAILYRLLQGLQRVQAPYRKAIEAHRDASHRWSLSPVEEDLKRRSNGRLG